MIIGPPARTSRIGPDEAAAEAAAAADAVGIRIAEAGSLGDAARVARLSQLVWGTDVGIPVDLVTALSRAGGVVLLAAREQSAPAADTGFALGFLGWADETHLHSHQVGVVPGYRGRGVGLALKLAQRAVCLAHGVSLMRWTFDPLLAPNARFNLARLGGCGTEFLPDFYGSMTDAINSGDRSDRLEVSWRLDRPLPERPPERRAPTTGPAVLEVDQAGWPRRTDQAITPGVLIAIPENYAQLREREDPRVPAWRHEVGQVLRAAFDAGLTVVHFWSGSYELGARGGTR